MDQPDDALVELRELAGVALAHEDLADAMREICRIAARAVVSAHGASLTTLSTSGPGAFAASNPWAEQLDELQYAEHEGPCLDAARTGAVLRVRDMASEPRWPSYTPRAVAQGALSMLSIPMTVEAKTIGALNMYSEDRDGFDAEDVSLAEIIAGHAGLAAQVAAALQTHRALAENLRAAMASRSVIGHFASEGGVRVG